MTRSPLSIDSATFSARLRQQVTLKNIASSSPFCLRKFHATPNSHSAAPAGVKRNSGSLVTFPVIVMELLNAIFFSFTYQLKHFQLVNHAELLHRQVVA